MYLKVIMKNIDHIKYLHFQNLVNNFFENLHVDANKIHHVYIFLIGMKIWCRKYSHVNSLHALLSLLPDGSRSSMPSTFSHGSSCQMALQGRCAAKFRRTLTLLGPSSWAPTLLSSSDVRKYR